MISYLRHILFFCLINLYGVGFVHAELAVSLIDGALEGVAIEGYDAVAYFKDGEPAKGNPEFSTNHSGTVWYFKNQENLEQFNANPALYLPQYGGHCAYAAANNNVVSSNPNRWKIVDGKLYLQANIVALKLWENNIPENIIKADKNWPSIQKKIKDKFANK
jgi:YHS domain-containing protein